jgi:alanine racemase
MNGTWPSWVEIRMDHLVENVRAIKQWIGPKVKLLAVVKANGYGHGAVPASWAALKGGADSLGVGSPQEGVELRDGGINSEIMVLGGCLHDQTDLIAEYDLVQGVQNRESLFAIEKAGKKARKNIKVHIKIDTGMRRLGVYPEEIPGLWKDIDQYKHIKVEGNFSHLATAEWQDKTYAQVQIRRFEELRTELKKLNIRIPVWHICNSGGTVHFPEAHYDMVRCGLMLYGVYPSQKMEQPISIRPAMAWKSRIVAIKSIHKGDSVSYGRNWTTEKDEIIGVIPVGYHDGYSKRLTNQSQVIVKNERVPTIGDICMDNTMILLSDVPDVQLGDEVILMGNEEQNNISVDEMAKWNGSISYESLCTIGRRVPRILFWKTEQIARLSIIDPSIHVRHLKNL